MSETHSFSLAGVRAQGLAKIMGFLLGGTGQPPLPKAAWGVALDSRESESVFCSWPDHLAGAFTPGSPP